jgi:hypothetical protein
MNVNSSGNKPSHHQSSSSSGKQFGIFVGKVKDVVDPSGLGRLRVWISQLSSTKEDDPGGWFTMRYCPPFAGATDTKKESTARDSKIYPETNQSYGFWMVPPTKNVHVVCGFINGDTKQGIWWAMLPQDGHTHALPAVASGSTHDGQIKPVAERNRFNTADKQEENRPEHPASFKLGQQGLDLDLRRGQSNAGPFRKKEQHPGLAYGFLTPGQHSLMLDDGEDGISGAIRLRTYTGHQIVMHEEGGFIYVVNAKGTAWVELDDEGNIDFYAAGNFSVNAEKNINLRAGNNINLDANNNINGVGRKNIRLEACETFNITGTNGVKITSQLNMDLRAAANLKQTAQRIDLNGPEALPADLPEEHSLFTNIYVGRSVASRVPEQEPWAGHSSFFGGEKITTPVGVENPELGEPQVTPAEESYQEAAPATEEEVALAESCIPEINLDSVILSQEGFDLLTSRMAYRGMMYADGQGFSVGYGTRVDIFGPGNPASRIDDGLKQALVAGPSEAEARSITRQIVDRHVTGPIRTTIKQAIAGRNICITQAVFDALVIAGYSNPASAKKMAQQVVDSGARSADGKPQAQDIAKIWASSAYVGNTDQRNADAQFALSGSVPSSFRLKTAEQARNDGVAKDRDAVLKDRARVPAYPWQGKLGNGPKTGAAKETKVGKPTPEQLSQWERSYFLNTGKQAPGTNLSIDQLIIKYGSPHIGENSPPNQPTQALSIT